MSTNLNDRIADVVKTFIADEEQYTDFAQLAINPSSLELEIADAEDDLPEFDYYPMMDLVRADPANPGAWLPDMDAIADVAAEYITVR